ncbi:VOC family protein [Actinomadura logoneensis]|uniref:VOC family protein n=1 Tax=Actinomadura logoneensis TaxID=2293572 RepID=UPI00131444E2|nr:VOC family protein [Actinomadura logoneensis]
MTTNPPLGTPNYIDLGIPDVERAKRFYGDLFGWSFQDLGPDAMGYQGVMVDGQMIAGLAEVSAEDTGGRHWWNLYFSTDDADATLKKITDAGGEVVQPAGDVFEHGRMAMVKDPSGAQFGLWQGKDMPGSGIVNEPGSFAWEELYTRDTARVTPFYQAVFDLRPERIDAGPGMEYYALNRPDGRPVGGIARGDRDIPMWLVYFEVEDTDQAVRRVQDGGGELLDGPAETPHGRIANVRDPFGVEFRVIHSTGQ